MRVRTWLVLRFGSRRRALAAYRRMVIERRWARWERDTSRERLRELREAHVRLAAELLRAERAHRDDLQLMGEHYRTIAQLIELCTRRQSAAGRAGVRP